MIRFNFYSSLEIFDTTEGYAMADEASGKVFWSVEWPVEILFERVHDRLAREIDPLLRSDLDWSPDPDEEW